MDDEGRTTAVGLFNYANSYWQSAVALDDDELVIGPKITHPDAPICFLYYHAIELFLKSHIRGQGVSVKGLRTKFGHRIEKMVKAAEDRGLKIVPEDREIFRFMAKSDQVLASRDIMTGPFTRPNKVSLDQTCIRLHEGVGEALRVIGLSFQFGQSRTDHHDGREMLEGHDIDRTVR